MAYKSDLIKRVRFIREPEGSFAVNQSGTMAYEDLEVSDLGSMALDTEMTENGQLQQRLDAMEKDIEIRRRCGLNFSFYLKGKGTAYGDGDGLPLTSSQMTMVGAMMGGLTHYSGSTVGTVTSPGTFRSGSAGGTGGTFQEGQIICVKSGSSYYEAVRIGHVSNASPTMYMETGLTFTPSASMEIFGGTTAYLKQDASGSMQFFVEGATDTSKYVLMGLNGGFGLDTPIGDLLTVSPQLQGADWATGSSGDIQEASYNTSLPRKAVDCLISFNNSNASADGLGSATRITPVVANLSITPGITWGDIEAYDGVNNIEQKFRQRSVPVATGQIDLYLGNHDHAFQADLQNGQEKSLMVQYGTAAGNIVVISMPRVQITNVTPMGVNDKEGLQIQFKALELENVATNKGSADQAKSALSIAWL